MSQNAKLIRKLLSRNNSLTYKELCKLLVHLGYKEIKTGKTAGSRKAFYNQKFDHIIRLHKPHPGNEIKRYLRKQIIEELNKKNLL